uniref:Uncharacterized protein n=1 Tax=viral metagenome TaxID=1070528 RepID=A0A6C0JAA7_9ZZZZ
MNKQDILRLIGATLIGGYLGLRNMQEIIHREYVERELQVVLASLQMEIIPYDENY